MSHLSWHPWAQGDRAEPLSKAGVGAVAPCWFLCCVESNVSSQFCHVLRQHAVTQLMLTLNKTVFFIQS